MISSKQFDLLKHLIMADFVFTEVRLKMPDFCAAYGCSNRRCLDTRTRGITFHM